jgi:hypothetical protein
MTPPLKPRKATSKPPPGNIEELLPHLDKRFPELVDSGPLQLERMGQRKVVRRLRDFINSPLSLEAILAELEEEFPEPEMVHDSLALEVGSRAALKVFRDFVCSPLRYHHQKG